MIADVATGYSTGFDGAGGVATVNTTAKVHHTGNTLTVCCRVNNSHAACTVTDTAGNTYTEIGASSVSAPGSSSRIFRAFNITGNAANVVSLHVGGTSAFTTVTVYETSGLGTGVELASAAAIGGPGSTAIDAGALSFSAQPAIIFGEATGGNTGMTNGTGFTFNLFPDGFGGYEASGFKIVSATEHFVATIAATYWSAASAAFGVATVSPTFSVTTQPTNTVSGVATSPAVVVTSTDTSDNATVVTATVVGSGTTLGGTLTATMASGVAAFANLIPTGAGTARNYHFAATGYTAIDSATFNVTAPASTATFSFEVCIMDDLCTKNSTSNIRDVMLFDTTTMLPKTGLAFGTSGLTCYASKNVAAPVAMTLTAMTLGIFGSTDGTHAGFLEIDATHRPGAYQLSIPNALVDTRGSLALQFTGAGCVGLLRVKISDDDLLAAGPTLAGIAITTDVTTAQISAHSDTVTVNTNVLAVKASTDLIEAKAAYVRALALEVHGAGLLKYVQSDATHLQIQLKSDSSVIATIPITRSTDAVNAVVAAG